jgi:hypothetical protein
MMAPMKTALGWIASLLAFLLFTSLTFALVINSTEQRDGYRLQTISEIVVPGVLRRYDTGDLLSATYPRQVAVVAPRDAMGETLSDAEFRAALPNVYEAKRIQVIPKDDPFLWLNP